MTILPARLRRGALVLPLRPGRFGVVFAGRSAQVAAPAQVYDPTAVFGAHRPPAARFDDDDKTVVCTPWWLD